MLKPVPVPKRVAGCPGPTVHLLAEGPFLWHSGPHVPLKGQGSRLPASHHTQEREGHRAHRPCPGAGGEGGGRAAAPQSWSWLPSVALGEAMGRPRVAVVTLA